MSHTAMNALPQAPAQLRAMQFGDLERVLAIERANYDFPWTRGNFVDSLAGGHLCELLVDAHDSLIGYYIAMPGVDEMHLLNLAVAPWQQRRGHALTLLEALQCRSRQQRLLELWLEVRASNARARKIYLCHGFVEVGVRRAYYPAARAQREDAIVMNLDLRAGA